MPKIHAKKYQKNIKNIPKITPGRGHMEQSCSLHVAEPSSELKGQSKSEQGNNSTHIQKNSSGQTFQYIADWSTKVYAHENSKQK